VLQLRAHCNVVGVDDHPLLQSVFPKGREALTCEFRLGMLQVRLWGLLPLDDEHLEKRRGENEAPGLYRVSFDFLPPSGHKVTMMQCRLLKNATSTAGDLMIFELGGFGPLRFEAICNVPKNGEARTMAYIKAELGAGEEWQVDTRRVRGE
jgi:hypothetical protein